ncbi:hypothetical protein HRI96_07085 [Treponema parvum]|uniref:Uncharacterized protein n=1 Tax=Treponema parvum TaxID=138851 RepID=A0A975EZT4_9SPIR|nr:hypothetical protein [Treponema parvum]QTQ11975.1 hypothetical protein HRI96_07085 [Treponema parvum]
MKISVNNDMLSARTSFATLTVYAAVELLEQNSVCIKLKTARSRNLASAQFCTTRYSI